MKRDSLLVTGGCGFIGSALVRLLAKETDRHIVVVDALTYAGNLRNIEDVPADRFEIVQVDVANKDAVAEVLKTCRPATVFHLAAETHVDRSIESPDRFLQTNIMGTFSILEGLRRLTGPGETSLVHVSTDEVYGALGETGRFTETTAYRPRSPYAASKASADHLVAAWHNTYGVPATVVNLCNNYGPFQFPEKLIPLLTIRGIQKRTMPVYGQGLQRREWLFVEDAARALLAVGMAEPRGESFNIGSGSDIPNIDVARAIADILDGALPFETSHHELISFVDDRPGHDFRYALDSTKVSSAIDWSPTVDFRRGLSETVHWFIERSDWWGPILKSRYDTRRLGLVELS